MGEPNIIGGVRLSEETMVVINDPLSPMAEEYRKFKEALVKMTKRDRFDNLIAVTSATVGEGKSMTAVNLAACLAGEYDHTVLLVDADLRRPTVHKYLGLGAQGALGLHARRSGRGRAAGQDGDRQALGPACGHAHWPTRWSCSLPTPCATCFGR
jgi:Mrp family chromosome partitioning ATPase